MTSSSIQGRDYYIDNIAGLLIIHMILGHAFQWAHLTETDKFYLISQKVLGFFMLWFCFKAGMYLKPKPFKVLVNSSFRRILVPFLIFSLIGYLTWSAKIYIEGDHNWIHFTLTPVKQIIMWGAVDGDLPLWYLSTLFMARVVFNWISIGTKYKQILCMVIFAVIPFAMRAIDNILPWYVANTSMAILFLGLGYYLRDVIKYRIICFAAVFLFVSFVLFIPTYVDMCHNTLLYGNYNLWYFIALAGIISVNFLFSLLPYRMPILNYIGENSMAYLCLHWIVFTLCRIVFNLMGYSYHGYSFFIIAVLISLAVISVINELLKKSRFNWILG